MKDLTALRDDLMELKPTLFAGVPRVFEKVYEGRFTNPHKIYLFYYNLVNNSFKIISFRYQESSGRAKSS
jgi:long-subunit acyl-CoA synthetase (AMP-forming)